VVTRRRSDVESVACVQGVQGPKSRRVTGRDRAFWKPRRAPRPPFLTAKARSSGPPTLGGTEKYPIFVWGEGGCAKDGLSNATAMAEIASHAGRTDVAGDGPRSRIVTWGVNSSGMKGADQSYYDMIKTPVLFVEGGADDIAYDGGLEGYTAIARAKHVIDKLEVVPPRQ
jgi:hypothetical protein